MTNFIKSESGAVTVDWVVLTAAVVGLGILVMGIVQDGLDTAADTLSDNINDAVTNQTSNSTNTPG